jgi:hypothetical protein
MEMRLEDVKIGGAFITNHTKRTGTVVHHGLSGTRVKWDAEGKKVRIERKPKWGETKKATVTEFVAPAKPELISSGTEVELVN